VTIRTARRPLRAALSAALLVLVSGACTGPATTPPPVGPPAGAVPAPATPPDPARIPLDGTPAAPVRWHPGAADADPAAVAVRRFVALQAGIASVPDPPSLVPLFATVAADDIAAVYQRRILHDLPADQRRVGPTFAWVAAVSTRTGGSALVDTCQDEGWSGPGAAPATRRVEPHAIRYAVAADGSTWKVIAIDPADPEPATAQACLAWGRGHTSPDSPP
jgi:hypothetical protein